MGGEGQKEKVEVLSYTLLQAMPIINVVSRKIFSEKILKKMFMWGYMCLYQIQQHKSILLFSSLRAPWTDKITQQEIRHRAEKLSAFYSSPSGK